ncbi:hypothetical protein LEA_17684, partial [human gut metagenome]
TYTGVHQVHSSCRVWKKDITTSNEYVDFSYAGIQEKNQYEVWMQQKYTDWQNCVDKYFVKTYNKIIF